MGKSLSKVAGLLSFTEVVRVAAPFSVKGARKQCNVAFVVSEVAKAW